MPVSFLTTGERERLNRFPTEISSDDRHAFFTLSDSDLALVKKQRGNHNRLGFALQLCALRYLGFSPDAVSTAPRSVVTHVARQVGVTVDGLAAYGDRIHTRTDHLLEIQDYLGFRKATPKELQVIGNWLLDRALEHDKPILLFQLACEKFHRDKIIRPGVTYLEKMVSTARNQAQRETSNRLSPLLTKEHRKLLDQLLIPDEATGATPLTWLRQGSTSNSASAILAALKKLDFLRSNDVANWDLSILNPNRLKFLAQLGRKSTNQALQRASEERRYPILVAFMIQSLVDVTDEIIEMYERCLAESYAKARRNLEEFRKSVNRSTNEKLILLQEIGRLVLDPDIADERLRGEIYQRMPSEKLHQAVVECEKIIRPLDDSYFDFLASRYSYIRQFVPTFLEALTFRSNLQDDTLLKAVRLLRQMNVEGKRAVSSNAPTDFIPAKWRPYVFGHDGRINRRYYELCVLWELRNALRAGNLWLDNSRRYANPESYL